MPYDEKIAERVRRILSGGQVNVVEKRMMGGLAFMVNGAMCCSVGRNMLLVRVRPEGRKLALARPHVRPMTLGGRTMSGFVRVEPEGFRTDAALARWLALGLKAANARAQSAATRRTGHVRQM